MVYDRLTIWLHWLTATLVATLWGLAQIIDIWPAGGGGRVNVRSLHVALGLALAATLLLRLIWRHTGGRRLPPAETGPLGLLAKLTHVALYMLLAVALVAGVTNTWVRGDSFFGLFTLASFAPGDRATRQLVGSAHELAADAILITAGLHAAAALFHHIVRRDDVLRRMLPGAG